MQRRHQVRKAFGNVLAGARIEPRLHMAEFVEAARKLCRQLGLAEGAQRGDDFGEGRRGRVVVKVVERPRVITGISPAVPLSLTSRASFARLGPRKGGGNG